MTGLDIDRPALLSGRYELSGVIGRGGMGVVYRAWDLQLERYVAVKILRGMAMDPIGRARFRAEGQTLARLSHPGLITLLDAQTEGDEPYLVMELVDGEPLTGLCQGQKMDVGEVAVLGVALAEALDHVHRRRIIHRDITPSNVLIGRDGRVKLADFGVARLLDGISGHTATGTMLGTAGYVSPEQVRREPLTPASDIYSLGLVLLEALSGEPSFVGSWDVVALARLTTSPRIDKSLPAPLRELLATMTATDPARRPGAAQVAIALRSLVGGAVPAVIPGPRFDQEIAFEPSADLPAALGLEYSAELPTAGSLKPVLPPGDTPPLGEAASPGEAPLRTSSRRGRRALIAAAIMVPVLGLGLALGSRIDWQGEPEPGAAGPSVAGPTETAAPNPRSHATDRTELPAPTKAPKRVSGLLVAGSTTVAVTSASATGVATPTATADATATAQTAAEARAASKAAKKAAQEEAKAARQSAKAEAKAAK